VRHLTQTAPQPPDAFVLKGSVGWLVGLYAIIKWLFPGEGDGIAKLQMHAAAGFGVVNELATAHINFNGSASLRVSLFSILST
jgi:hypothetical protein